MTILLLLLLILCLYGMRKKDNDEDYMSKRQTYAIRGIFTCFIFLSHTRQYYTLSDNWTNMVFNLFLDRLGQLMVVVFFFYSGYGVIKSYANNEGYKNTFLKNRILKTWLHFFCAVCMFLLIDFILGIDYSPLVIALAFTGYESVGNSNWFVFDTLVLYMFSLLSFYFFPRFNKREIKLLLNVTVLTILLFVSLKYVKQSWWYDTILAYPFGMLYFMIKKSFDKLLNNHFMYYVTFLIILMLFACCYLKGGAIFYNIAGCFFALLITIFTFKISVGNKVLDFIGKYSFFIYIYMRIPMIILDHFSLNNDAFLFTIVSGILTLVLAVSFGKIQDKIDKIVLG